ncbi:Uncharacterised protein [Cedecea neteri]|uniref:Methyltransferase type 11 domain-containing protein n=1 Tax=Cedecea neteri TaxID=158822 RepID=A0A2X3IET8_9ENTR|nr:Uncharacterised protein [Cedecea neteri]
MLEIAAGSFRDIVQLTKRGVEGHGIDFSPESVGMAKKLYPSLQDRFSVMNAFNLEYPDKHFDLTYHNGFWVLFFRRRHSEDGSGTGQNHSRQNDSHGT